MNFKMNNELDYGSFILSEEFTLKKASEISVITPQIIKNLKKRDLEYPLKKLTPIYRGESEKFQTTLLPGIFRKIANNNFPPSYEKNLFNKYIKTYNIVEKNPLNILSKMQHYGFPTRLLDWTLNLEIALYFCCKFNATKDGYVYVYIPSMTYVKDGKYETPLDAFYNSIQFHYYKQILLEHTERDHLEFWKSITNNSHQFPDNTIIPWWLVFSPLERGNTREKMQESIFTFHLGYVNEAKLYAAPQVFNKFAKQTVGRIIIPAQLKKEIIYNIEANVNTSILYPEPVFFDEDYLFNEM